MIKLALLLPVILLTNCSTITDFLLKQDEGLSIDAQLGHNENKVKTGVGSLGVDKESNITVEDSQAVAVHNTDDRYHITSEGAANVTIYETNYWLYAAFGLFLVGKPALTRFWARRDRKQTKLDPHEYVTYTSIHPDPSSGRDNED